jgi:hypothetical protein
MIKAILIGIVALIAGVLIFAATKPDTFRVVRSTTIKAPADKVFPLINDFRNWGSWSPYEKKDPAMTRTFGSTTAGKGAVYEWNGNSNVGQGRMEITESNPSSKVAIKLDFIKPFEGHNVATFNFEPKGDTTQVSWTMTGPSAYITKLMGVFFNMDKMIGDDFAVGLANLKAQAEK